MICLRTFIKNTLIVDSLRGPSDFLPQKQYFVSAPHARRKQDVNKLLHNNNNRVLIKELNQNLFMLL